jgi:uncharacterized protein (TIGR02466 family)
MTLNRATEDGVMRCWPTPVYRRQHDTVGDVNAALAEHIRRRSREEPSAKASNLGAWQSRADLLRADAPAVQRLIAWISEAVAALERLVLPTPSDAGHPVAEAWGMLYRARDAQGVHVHPGSVWSGVYYVEVPELAGEQGGLELLDPRTARRVRHGTGVHRIAPSPGLLVAFPSWLEHRVRPHDAPGERIAVAFNVGYRR